MMLKGEISWTWIFWTETILEVFTVHQEWWIYIYIFLIRLWTWGVHQLFSYKNCKFNIP
jgi:hypothetical protein